MHFLLALILWSCDYIIQDVVEVLDIETTPGVNVTGQIDVTNATECESVGCYEIFTEVQGFQIFNLFSQSCLLGIMLLHDAMP